MLFRSPMFQAIREQYFDDDEFRLFQNILLETPDAGDVVPHGGGLRKVRVGDPKRNKGKRGGLRVVYYWHLKDAEYILFTVYDKDELSDLTPKQWQTLGTLLSNVLESRRLHKCKLEASTTKSLTVSKPSKPKPKGKSH